MNVGTNKPGIQITKNIFEDSYSQKILLLGNDNEKLNNFIYQNLFKDDNVILVDSNKHFANKSFISKNIKILDFNKSNIYFDPVKILKTESDIKFLTNFILSSFKFKTKSTPKDFEEALISFLHAIIGYVFYYDNDNLNLKNVYNTALKAINLKDQRSILDIEFSEIFDKTTLTSFAIKKYFNFKTFNSKIQKEVISQCITILEFLIKKPYIKENSKNTIEISTEYLDNNNIIIIPSDKEKGDLFKITDFLLIKILALKKTSEDECRTRVITKTLHEISLIDWTNVIKEINYDCLKKTHVIFSGYDNSIHNKLLQRTLNLSYTTVATTINFKNITNIEKIFNLSNNEVLLNYQIILETEQNEQDIAFIKNITNDNLDINIIENNILIIAHLSENYQKVETIIDDVEFCDIDSEILEISNHFSSQKKSKRNTNTSSWNI